MMGSRREDGARRPPRDDAGRRARRKAAGRPAPWLVLLGFAVLALGIEWLFRRGLGLCTPAARLAGFEGCEVGASGPAEEAGPLVLVAGALAGAAALAAGIWAWAGRTRGARAFAKGQGPYSFAGLPLGLLPGGGLMLLAGALAGLHDLVPGTASAIVGPVAVPAASFGLLLGAAMFVSGLIGVIPRWWAPRWYRDWSRRQAARDTRNALGPLTFAVLLATAFRNAPVSSEREARREARRRFGRPRPSAVWRAGHVYDPDTRRRDHAFARRGTVEGTLTLYSRGLAFAASRPEDVLRGRAATVVLGREEISGARVVPARAGADGRPRDGRLFRSFRPRLVVDTDSGSHVFEVARGRARYAAERIGRIAASGKGRR